MAKQNIDLNLIRVFDVVMRHRSVSAAGRELGVTASAVSHALSRLRQALGDELFVSVGTGMQPTARALDLAPSIRGGLAHIDEALAAQPFRPDGSVRTFRVAASDYFAVVVLAPLIRELMRVAPEIQLRVFPFSRLDLVRHLDENRLDLVLGWFEALPPHVRRQTIASEPEAVVVRSGHPLAQGQVTRERLFAFPFLVVELTGTDEQDEDGFLDDRGVRRRVWIDRLVLGTGKDAGLVGHVAVSLPHYSAVPAILEDTDLVATMPLRLALPAITEGRLVRLESPLEPLTVMVEMIWHERSDHDPGLFWLRERVLDIMRTES